MKATITKNGAILLGKHTTVDAHEKTRPIRIITHAHADHLIGLHQSLKHSHTTIMTPATKDFIKALKGPQLLQKGNVKAIDYNQPLIHDDEQITLHKVDHILGAAQVLVEDKEGTRILYTGDFRMSNTPVIQSDILIIEATYGSPWHTRNFEDEAKQMLISIVEKGLKQGSVYIFGYHGKLQEIMQILHEAKIKAPFVMPEKILEITKIHQKHGVNIHRPLYSTTHQLQSTLLRNEQYITFYHMNSRKKIGLNKFRICVSGWEFNFPCRQTGEKEYTIALSDHSDFKGLLEYTRQSKPKLVITDNYRAGDATALAKQIEKQLGIEARPLPT